MFLITRRDDLDPRSYLKGKVHSAQLVKISFVYWSYLFNFNLGKDDTLHNIHDQMMCNDFKVKVTLHT